jgi:hypothetical protein
MRTLLLLLVAVASSAVAQITIDGNASEWTGTAPSTANSAVYSISSAGTTVKLNEWIWKDASGDQRTDFGPTNNDLLEVRFASDTANLYFLIKTSVNADTNNQVQISIRRPNSISTQTFLAQFADTQVPIGAEWDYVIVTRGGSQSANNLVYTPDFSGVADGAYAQDRATGVLEGSVPWSSLGGVPGDLAMIVTVTLYEANSFDNTIDIGGGVVSNCLDLMTTTSGNTWLAVQTGTIDYAESISFLSNNNVLPIRLASFTAQVLNAGGVTLSWTTLSETDNFGFTVERKGEGESQFIELPHSFVAGNGTSVEPHRYSFTDASAGTGSWFYRLKQIDLDGSVHYSDAVQAGSVTSVEEQGVPAAYALFQNYPNPFNPSTTISFSIAGGQGTFEKAGAGHGSVRLAVYDMLGREVAVLLNGPVAPGLHSVSWNAAGMPSGNYFYRLQTELYTATRKLLLLR